MNLSVLEDRQAPRISPARISPPLRLTSLDSLRGIAALTVVLHHALVTFPSFWSAYEHANSSEYGALGWLAHSPLHLFWGGWEAVVVFFVLSGFVLTLALTGPVRPSYPLYFVRRMCRIYLPYMAAVAVAALLVTTRSGAVLRDSSVWFNEIWRRQPDWAALRDHVFVLGAPEHNYLNPVVWSLVHEIRISIIFPLIVWLFGRFPVAILVPASFAFSVGAKIAMRYTASSLLETASYLFLFICGGALAWKRAQLRAWLEALSPAGRFWTVLAAIALLNARWTLPWRVEGLDAVLVWIGAVMLVALAAEASWVVRMFDRAPLRFFGEISYSLYLVHLPLLLTMLYALRARFPAPLTVLISLPASILVATVFHNVVEKPALRLGALARRARSDSASVPA